MNFPFHIERFGRNYRRCQLYTVRKNENDFTEASKFLQNQRNKESEDFARLSDKLKKIKNKLGARIGFFKPEGRDYDMVHALHSGVKKQGYLQMNHLRWYCLRLSERCVLLGNGGVKIDQRTQDDPHLAEKESDMRWVDQVLTVAFRRGDLVEDDNGNLKGRMHYPENIFEEYGLQ